MSEASLTGALLYWDEASGTGLCKDGCCGYRQVARCAECARVAFADEMRVEGVAVVCASHALGSRAGA